MNDFPLQTRDQNMPPPSPRLIYVANPYSVHVDVWRKALARCDIPLHIETAAYPQVRQLPGASVEHRPPRWLRGPNWLRYIWTALANRLRRRRAGDIVHAHGTSGNGVVAWFSGYPYILTTYGTEVTLAHRRGRLFEWMISRVLRGAERLTATSTEMVDVLTQKYEIPRERIHLFDLGIEQETFHPPDAAQRSQLRSEVGIAADEPVWVSLKRAVPWNRTVEVIQAFFQYCRSHPRGRLVVLCGDSLSDYARRVERVANASAYRDRVHLLNSWLDQEAVARWLQLADFGLSVAESDQMSNSILEAMACGAIPILLDIEGYQPLKARQAPVLWIDDDSPQHLCEVYATTAAISPGDRALRSREAQRYVEEYHSRRMAEHHLRRLYQLAPATDRVTARAA